MEGQAEYAERRHPPQHRGVVPVNEGDDPPVFVLALQDFFPAGVRHDVPAQYLRHQIGGHLAVRQAPVGKVP